MFSKSQFDNYKQATTTGLDALKEVYNLQSSMVEKFYKANSQLAQSAVDTSFKTFGALVEAKSIQEAASLQSDYLKTVSNVLLEGYKSNAKLNEESRVALSQVAEKNIKVAEEMFKKVADEFSQAAANLGSATAPAAKKA